MSSSILRTKCHISMELLWLPVWTTSLVLLLSLLAAGTAVSSKAGEQKADVSDPTAIGKGLGGE